MERDANGGVERPDLLDRLKALCDTFRERRGVQCRLGVRAEHTRLEPVDADAAYQAIRELLTLYMRRIHAAEIEISSELRLDGSIVFHVGNGAAARARGMVDSYVLPDDIALSNIDRRLRDCEAYLELQREAAAWASVVFPGRHSAAP